MTQKIQKCFDRLIPSRSFPLKLKNALPNIVATVEMGRKINVVKAIVCIELLSVLILLLSFCATRLKLYLSSVSF